MSSIPSSLARTTGQLGANMLLANLRRTNLALLQTQTELSTGKRVNKPSDAPESAGTISGLRTILEQYTQRNKNLTQASGVIDNTDQALADLSALLLESQNIASSQIGIGSNADTRRSEAAVIDAHLDTLFQIANRDYQGIYLFAGRASDSPAFVEALGGVRYVGSSENLSADLGLLAETGINANGNDAFKALSTRVQGAGDLDPQLSSETRLDDLRGAQNQGITRGTVRIDVNGTTVEADLTTADTVGDVVTRINNAIASVDPTAGQIAITGDTLTLTANAGSTLQIDDIGAGRTAADLGLNLTAASGSAAGADLDPKLTGLTRLADLGVPVDLASGLKVTNGEVTRTLDFSAATTIQDLINIVDAADLGLRMEIDADAQRLSLVNEVSGTELSIGEVAGGSTATDLGLRSFAGWTQLSDLNHGFGVGTVEGKIDFRVSLHDGTAIDVNLDGATTAQDAIDAITAAATALGLIVGNVGDPASDLNVGFAADGNGLLLEDNTTGAQNLRVEAQNGSTAAGDLGLLVDTTSSTLQGEDVATVRSESVFTHLMMLREGLINNDDRLITQAGEKIQQDLNTIASVRAEVGVRARRIEDSQNRNAEQDLQARSLLSGLQDSDYAAAISRFAQLEQQLQANLMTGQRITQMSLLDFLR